MTGLLSAEAIEDNFKRSLAELLSRRRKSIRHLIFVNNSAEKFEGNT